MMMLSSSGPASRSHFVRQFAQDLRHPVSDTGGIGVDVDADDIDRQAERGETGNEAGLGAAGPARMDHVGHGYAERFGLRRDLGGGIKVADAPEPVSAAVGNDVGLAAFRAHARRDPLQHHGTVILDTDDLVGRAVEVIKEDVSCLCVVRIGAVHPVGDHREMAVEARLGRGRGDLANGI
jgi:hypothetical protein